MPFANSLIFSMHFASSTSLKHANVICGLVFHSKNLVLIFSEATLFRQFKKFIFSFIVKIQFYSILHFIYLLFNNSIPPQVHIKFVVDFEQPYELNYTIIEAKCQCRFSRQALHKAVFYSSHCINAVLSVLL